MNPPQNQGVVAGRYSALESDRQVHLERARRCSAFTLPMLIPPQGHSSATSYPTPFQSLGARGVNQLASKLLLTLLPPEQSFFRLRLDKKVETDLQSDPNGQDDDIDKFEAALSDMEQSVLREIGSRGIRSKLHEGLLHLIVGGNTLLYVPKPEKKGKGQVRLFRLDQFAVQRDHEGNVLEIVVKEVLSPESLPDSVRELVLNKMKAEAAGKDTNEVEKTVEVYTQVCRCDGRWEIKQEVKGTEIPESKGTYPLDMCPWFPLRWKGIDGENYGRGYCEEYLGDLASLEGLSKALVEAGAVASKIIILVDPNGVTRMETLADAPNGAIREGKAEEVTILNLQKTADLQFVGQEAAKIESRLSYAFLLNSAVQRQAERVTAEEIRLMAQELEDALGGVYSNFADELQLPLAMLVMKQMQSTGELPKLPEDTVHPSIVAGLDALGRNHELARLDQALDGALQKFGPNVMPYINMSDYLTRRFSALGIETKGLIRTEDEVNQMQQQQQQAAMQQQTAPKTVDAVGKMANTALQAKHDQRMAQQQQDQSNQ